MSDQERSLDRLRSVVMGSIESIASTVEQFPEGQRAIKRVLAHLWSAHDELELLVPKARR